MSGPASSAPANPRIPILWTAENFVSSNTGKDDDGDGCVFTRNAPAEVPTTNDKGTLTNTYVAIVGKEKYEDGNYRFFPFASSARDRKHAGPTTQGFDEVLDFTSLTSLFEYLKGLKLDVPAVVKASHKGKGHRLEVNVNTEVDEDCNAYYSIQGDDITFASCKKMHTAADLDAVFHEFGHYILAHLEPRFTEPPDVVNEPWPPHGTYSRGAQDAIHEGFADTLAALVNGNSVIGEDFTPKGLRNVDNKLTILTTSGFAHDRGRVYSGFFWSMKKLLESREAGLPATEDATTATIGLLWEHALHYQVGTPSSEDFVDAVLAGAEALINADRLHADRTFLRDAILDEANKRGMVTGTFLKERRAKGTASSDPLSFLARPSGNRRYLSAKHAREELAKDGRTEFGAPSVVATAAGEREYHPQVYITTSGQRVSVVGAGLLVTRIAPQGMFFTPQTEVTHINTEGMRDLSREGAVDETVKVAAGAAQMKLRNEMGEWAARIQQDLAAQRKKPESEAQPYRAGLLARDAKALAAALAIIAKGGLPAPSLALLPGAVTLAWRFDANDITGYVDAATGKVTLARNYIVN